MHNRVIEIHDSTVERVSISDQEATIWFSCVYIHESTGIPAVDAGRVWKQEATLRIEKPTVTRSFSAFPADLLDGQIMLGDTTLKNKIPVPFSHKGLVELCLKSWNDEVLLITGRSAELKMVGEPKYVEEFGGGLKS